MLLLEMRSLQWYYRRWQAKQHKLEQARLLDLGDPFCNNNAVSKTEVAVRLLALILMFLMATSCGPMSLAASADPVKQAVSPTQNSAAPSAKVQGSHKWSKKKKIAVAVAAGCLIATAIAVPVAVSAHHSAMARHKRRRKLSNEFIVYNQELATERQHQQILNLLNQGPALSIVQRASLQSQLDQIQLKEFALKQAFVDLELGKAINAPTQLLVGRPLIGNGVGSAESGR
jgi:hypothetical protein